MPKTFYKEVVVMKDDDKKIGQNGEDMEPKDNTTDITPAEPGFFGKIGAWIGNEWNTFWHTPSTRAQRMKRAATFIGIAGVAGAIGYGAGYARGSNSMPDGEDEYGDDSCGEEPIVTEFVDNTESYEEDE
jgi:hypothetical protein